MVTPAAATAYVVVVPRQQAVLRGVIRASDSDAPVRGALVEIWRGGSAGEPPDAAEVVRVRTDASGSYAAAPSGVGLFHVRVSCLGYLQRRFDVLLGDDADLRLDIVLVALPRRLGRVMVDAARSQGPATVTEGDAAAARPGSRTLEAPAYGATWTLGRADPLQALTAAGLASTGPDGATALHVRGGSADQNLVLLDDVPLYNPVHATGGVLAVTPDAIGRVTMHAGVPPSRFGGALSSVLAVETVTAPASGLRVSGGLGSAGARIMLTGALPASTGAGAPPRIHVLGAARRSITDIAAAALGVHSAATSSFSDVFGKIELAVGPSTVEVLAFQTKDHLAFDAEAAGDPRPEESSGTAGTVEDPGQGEGPRNAFRWRSGTAAVVWRSASARARRLTVRAWDTRYGATSAWSARAGALALSSRLRHQGMGGDGWWRLPAGEIAAGVGYERLYAGTHVGSVGAAPGAEPGAAVPDPGVRLASLYVEQRIGLSARWSVSAGIRGELASDARSPLLEPRVVLRVTTASPVALSVGIARLHQRVQSLGNEESLVGGLVGLALPTIADPSGQARLARADQLTGSLEAHPGRRMVVTVDGYTRRMTDLRLVAPMTGQPFATGTVIAGRGYSSGAALSLAYRGSRLDGQFAADVGTATRETAAGSYRPTFNLARVARLGMEYRSVAATAIGLDVTAIGGRRTTATLGAVEWSAPTVGGGLPGELAGSPQAFVGRLGSDRLPAYLRVDVRLRRTWRVHRATPGATVAATVRVVNLLNRANVVGIVQPTTLASPQGLRGAGRWLVLGIDWTF